MLIIYPKEKSEEISAGKADLSHRERIQLNSSYRLGFEGCKQKKIGECLLCKFCINFLLLFKNEMDKEKLIQNVTNLFFSYPRVFALLHFIFGQRNWFLYPAKHLRWRFFAKKPQPKKNYYLKKLVNI